MSTTKNCQNVFYCLSDLNEFLTNTKLESPFWFKNSLKSYKVVKDFNTFKLSYKKSDKNNGFAEFIRENQPTKMYFDVDYYAEEGDSTMLDDVKAFLLYSIKDIYKIDITEKDITILEANGLSKKKGCYKHSYHFIINNGIFFTNNKEHKRFIDYLFKSSADITISNPKRNELFNKMLYYNPFSKEQENALDKLAYSNKSHAFKMVWSRNEGEDRFFKSMEDVEFEKLFIGHYTNEPIEKYFDNTAIPTTDLWKRDTAYPLQNKHNKDLYSEKMIEVNYTLPIPDNILTKIKNLIDRIHPDANETKRQLINTNPNVWFIEYSKSNHNCLCCKYTHKNNRFYIKIVNNDIYYVCYKTQKQQLLVPNRHTHLYWNEDYNGVDDKPLMKQLPYIDLDSNKDTTLYLQANMGIGKTVEIRRYLQEDQFIGKSVIFISYRVFLCSEYKKNFGDLGFNDYRDLTNNDSDEKYKKVICCFDSLARFQGKKYDVVILDEIDSVLAHASSDLMKVRRGIAQSVFGFMVSKAKLVINADAYLDNERVISSMKLLRKDSEHYAIRNRFIRETNRKVYIYKHYVINRKSNEANRFLDKLLSDILKHDKKIVVVSMSKRFNVKIQDLLDENNVKYYSYNSETDDKTKKEHSKDIRGKWRNKNIKVVLYTSTISAGVSFQDTTIDDNGEIDELLDEEKFDSLYCYCGANQRNSCSVDDVKQMLFRVRQLKSGEMNILLNYGLTDKAPIADNVEDVKKLFNNNEKSIFSCYGEPPIEPQMDNDGYFSYDNTNWKHNLFCCNIARREQSSLYFEPILLDFFDSIKIPYEIVKPINHLPEELTQSISYVKETNAIADAERLKRLIECENITKDEFEKLDRIKKDHHQDLTPEQTEKYLKKYWLTIFNIDSLADFSNSELEELLKYYYNPSDKTLIQRFRRFKLYLSKDIRTIKEKYNENMNKHITETNDIFDYWDIIDSKDEVILWVDDILKILHKSDTYIPRDLREERKSIIDIQNISDSKEEIIKYVINRYDKMKQILDIREPQKTYTDGKGKKIIGVNEWSDRKLKGFLKSFFSYTIDYEFKTDSEMKGVKTKAKEYILVNKYHSLGKANTRQFSYISHDEILQRRALKNKCMIRDEDDEDELDYGIKEI